MNAMTIPWHINKHLRPILIFSIGIVYVSLTCRYQEKQASEAKATKKNNIIV